MPELVTLGRVSSIAVGYVTERVRDAAGSLGLDPSRLRLVVAESRELLDRFLQRAMGGAGAVGPASAITHAFVAGKPTVLVAASELYELEEVVARGELLIALAHAKLHGSEEYYAIRMPRLLGKLLRHGAPGDAVQAVLYLVASGVKGYEATRLLVGMGYLREMEEVHKLHLRVTPEEREAWRRAGYDLRAQALLALNTFKALANALPALSASGSGELRELFDENLGLLPGGLRPAVERTLEEALPAEPQDTFERIERCTESLGDVVLVALL